MAKTFEQRQRERLIRQIGTRIVTASWYWRGTEFSNFGYCGVTPQTQAYVRITVYFKYLKVNLETENEYNIPNQVCMFGSDDAMTDAVNWIVDRLIELHKVLTVRTAPFAQGYNNYQKALRGE